MQWRHQIGALFGALALLTTLLTVCRRKVFRSSYGWRCFDATSSAKERAPRTETGETIRPYLGKIGLSIGAILLEGNTRVPGRIGSEATSRNANAGSHSGREHL